MFISRFVSLWEAAEIAQRKSGQDGRQLVLSALKEGAIEAEVFSSDKLDPLSPRRWQRPRSSWYNISIAWGPYSSGLDPSRDVRLRRADVEILFSSSCAPSQSQSVEEPQPSWASPEASRNREENHHKPDRAEQHLPNLPISKDNDLKSFVHELIKESRGKGIAIPTDKELRIAAQAHFNAYITDRRIRDAKPQARIGRPAKAENTNSAE